LQKDKALVDLASEQMPPQGWFRYITSIRGGRPIGRDGQIRVHYFLDLLSAAHNKAELALMSQILADWITKSATLEGVAAIAGPKNGNTLLVNDVSQRLEKNSIFVRNSILFGKWIEGVWGPGQKVLMVDDVASDGEMLREAVLNLRKCGVHTEGVYVLVDRNEGDAARGLAKEGVQYNYVFQLSDQSLEGISRQAHQ
jgi:orotate phosphoribosyltransferase